MQIPIFPLNGAVLFPNTYLPLNIFEERYIEMVDYSLANKRLIGMIQYGENGHLFDVGCVGKITSFSETTDGRYIINLEGKYCFSKIQEVKGNYKFRLVKAEILKNQKKPNRDILDDFKTKLLEKFKNYISIKEIDLSLSEIKKLEADQLAKFIAMTSPFENLEKQMLLEIKTFEDFCNKLLSILEIYLVETNKERIIN